LIIILFAVRGHISCNPNMKMSGRKSGTFCSNNGSSSLKDLGTRPAQLIVQTWISTKLLFYCYYLYGNDCALLWNDLTFYIISLLNSFFVDVSLVSAEFLEGFSSYFSSVLAGDSMKVI
jgi:hypothetical protein